MIFKLIKLSRRIRILFGGYQKYEKRWELFTIPDPLHTITIEYLYGKLIPYGYQYNYASHTYRKQIFTVRKLTDITHQIHLRFYRTDKGIRVTGHYELQPEASPIKHLRGKDLRKLTLKEKAPLTAILL